MSTTRKIALLTWTVIILLIINIAALGTMAYHSFRHSTPEEQNPRGIGGGFIEKELQLSPMQKTQFKTLRMEFFSSSSEIFKQQRENKQKMIRELSNDTPDTSELHAIALSMGELHKQLKINTYRHFIALQKICTPTQRKKLKTLLNKIPQLNDAKPGKEMQYRHHHGWKNQQQRINKDNN
ncbi:MAG: periplasmic heavy metal sensor [Lentimicrobiaceae bacterium]|jgi:Spy/CpxP family protein refolding chaperone|nr:periplasmic heavy metal sensor [Lentimicrobiaceae bacterium]